MLAFEIIKDFLDAVNIDEGNLCDEDNSHSKVRMFIMLVILTGQV